jgi:hypothetical protein
MKVKVIKKATSAKPQGWCPTLIDDSATPKK